MVPGVGIGKEEDVAPGGSVTLKAGPRLSVPSLGKCLPSKNAEPRIGQAFHDFRGLVIVDRSSTTMQLQRAGKLRPGSSRPPWRWWLLRSVPAR